MHGRDVKPGSWSDPRRGSRQSRGYGKAWDKLRELILARDAGLCQVCLPRGLLTVGRTVDHIKPKAEGGTDDPANLQTICDDCHEAKTLAEAMRARGIGDGMSTSSAAPLVKVGRLRL